MTLKDVAVKANCSVATVSKALKNSSEISEDAKQRILLAAKEIGYLKKATTHTAVLGGIKTAIFCDNKGENFDLFHLVLPIAKKSGLELVYVTLSEKDSYELMEQIGAFALIVAGNSKIKDNDKVFAITNGTDGVKEFFEKAGSYMPLRPSRAGGNKTYTKRQKTVAPKAREEKPAPKPQETKKEEIWLL